MQYAWYVMFPAEQQLMGVNPMAVWGVVLNTKVAYGNHLSQLIWSSKIKHLRFRLALFASFLKLRLTDGDKLCILLS